MPITLGGQQCQDPKDFFDLCAAKSLPLDPWFKKANGYRCPGGHEAGRGWLLISQKSLNALGMTPGDLSQTKDVVFDDCVKKVTIKGVSIVSTTLVTPGVTSTAFGGSDSETWYPGDENATYVVEIADRRIRLANIPANAAYNLRNCDGGSYFDETTNGGTAWTWQQMVNDLADKMQSGLTLSLPYTPQGTPENFDFYTTSAIKAISTVCDRLGCMLGYDPLHDTFYIYESGVASSDFENALAALKNKTLDVDPQRLRAPVPRKVRVLFPFFPPPTDGTNPFDSLDEDAPQYFPTSTTNDLRGKCWSNTIQYLNGDLGSPAIGSESLTARAMERRDKFYQAYLDSAVRPMLRVYAGVLDDSRLLPAHRVKGIAWYDYGSSDGGICTEIYRGLGILPAGWSLDLTPPECNPTFACVKCCCCCAPCKGPLWLTIPPFVIDHGHCGMCTGVVGNCGPVQFPKFMLQPEFTPGSTSYPRCWSCSTASPWIVAISKVGDVSVGTINLSISVCCNAKNQCPILTISGIYTINAQGALYFNVNAGTYPMCIGPVPADAVVGCQVRDDDDEGGPVIWAATWTAATVNDCDEGNWGCACHSSFVANFDLRCGVVACEATGIPNSFPVTMIDASIVLGNCTTPGSGCFEIGAPGMGGGGKTATMTAIVGPVVIDGTPGIDSVMCDQMWKGTITTTSGCRIQIYLLLTGDGTFALVVQNDPTNNPGCTTIVNNILATDFTAVTLVTLRCNPLCLTYTFNGAALLQFGAGCGSFGPMAMPAAGLRGRPGVGPMVLRRGVSHP